MEVISLLIESICLFDRHAHFTMQRKIKTTNQEKGKEGDLKIRPRMDFLKQKESFWPFNPQVSHTKYQIHSFSYKPHYFFNCPYKDK